MTTKSMETQDNNTKLVEVGFLMFCILVSKETGSSSTSSKVGFGAFSSVNDSTLKLNVFLTFSRISKALLKKN
jgi:hypothetical protein